MEFRPHKYQSKILKSKSRFILASSGIQGGKTMTGGVWLCQQIEKKGLDRNYLLAAPTYKILQQSTLPKFFSILGDISKLGQYRKADSEIKLTGGTGKVYIRSTEQPDLLEGMTIDGAAWLDEAGQMSETVWTNVLGRTAIAMSPILLTTTPYTMNWVYREIIKRWLAGDKNYEVVAWTSVDNPYFPKEEYEQRKATMNEADFARRYMGEWRQMRGLVYPDFSYAGNVIAPIPLSNMLPASGWTFYKGVDFGFTNPTAVVWIAKSPDKDYFIIDEYYERNRTSIENYVNCERIDARYPTVKATYCDYTAKDQINEWYRVGAKHLASMKIDKSASIRRVTEFIRAGRFRVFSNCKHLIDEFENYRFAQTKADDNEEFKEETVKYDDHALDAMRYAVYTSSMNDGLIMPRKEQMESVKEAEKLITVQFLMDKSMREIKEKVMKPPLRAVVMPPNKYYSEHR